MKIITYLFLLAVLLVPPLAPHQWETIIMAPPSVEVDPLVALDVEDFLNDTPPTEDTNIFAISGTSLIEGGTFVSLVGLDPDTPDPYDWSMATPGSIIWSGSITIEGGVPLLYEVETPPEMRTSGPGGGVEIYFPWDIGKKMLFGPRGIHGEGDWGWNGMYAVDWVSGNDFGAEAASAAVYASASGTIDWVCHDDIQSAVRISNGTDYYGYFHLTKDTSLTGGRSFSRGQYIGRLLAGSFDDNCGYAEQAESHYHIHWVFAPDDGHFMAESWILTFGDQKWKKGNQTVTIGQWMTGGGGTGGPGDPGDPGDPGTGTPGQVIRFWSYVLSGVSSVANMVFGGWPTSEISQEGDEQWDMATNIFASMIRDANVMLVNDVINLMPIVYLATAIIAIEILQRVIGVIIVVIMLIKMLPFL